jgi:hypothetical protein
LLPLILAAFAATVLAGCAEKPRDEDIRDAVRKSWLAREFPVDSVLVLRIGPHQKRQLQRGGLVQKDDYWPVRAAAIAPESSWDSLAAEYGGTVIHPSEAKKGETEAKFLRSLHPGAYKGMADSVLVERFRAKFGASFSIYQAVFHVRRNELGEWEAEWVRWEQP